MEEDRYHVTEVSARGVYGHSVSYCDEAGCNGSEQYLGSVEQYPGAVRGAILDTETGEVDTE